MAIKSLANVVAHEIAHSWTGNLITNQTWEHFWLNEGYTVWLERKIMEKITQSNDYFNFIAQIGLQALEDSLDMYGKSHEYTKMVPNLENVDQKK